jgi:hypothetical protein
MNGGVYMVDGGYGGLDTDCVLLLAYVLGS